LITAFVLILALILSACSTTTTTQAPAQTTTQAPPQATTQASPQTTTQAPAQTRTLKFNYTMPKGASVGKGYEWFAEEIGKRTQGRYKIETYPSNTLIPLAAALDSIKKGVADITNTSFGTFPKDFPLTMITAQPTYGWPGENVDNIYKASQLVNELIESVPEVKAEFNDYQIIWTQALDPYNFISKKKEVRKPEDFKGMKVGGPPVGSLDIVNRYGGAGVRFIPPDSYLNLDKGVAEAAFLTFAQVSDYKLYEICSYYYVMEFGCGVHPIFINKDTWATIPPADQKIFLDTGRDAIKVAAEGSLANIEKGKKAVLDKGYKIEVATAEEIAAWQKAAEPVIEKWAKDAQDLGVSKEVTDKVFKKWMELRTKYGFQ